MLRQLSIVIVLPPVILLTFPAFFAAAIITGIVSSVAGNTSTARISACLSSAVSSNLLRALECPPRFTALVLFPSVLVCPVYALRGFTSFYSLSFGLWSDALAVTSPCFVLGTWLREVPFSTGFACNAMPIGLLIFCFCCVVLISIGQCVGLRGIISLILPCEGLKHWLLFSNGVSWLQ